ncbi:hypothetical protein PSCICL_40030 [Pseudomonas cichorii]|nr:hypothetical protein PSCICL_40030 [Pseudomonas cichorii]
MHAKQRFISKRPEVGHCEVDNHDVVLSRTDADFHESSRKIGSVLDFIHL